MNLATRIRNVVSFLVLALAGTWSATAYVADALGYSYRLGGPLFHLGAYPVYAPWAWLSWSSRFESVQPGTFAVAAAITFGTAALGLGLTALLGRGSRLELTTSGAFGTARWATTEELKAAGLLVDAGVVLCQTADARYEPASNPKDGTPTWRMQRPGRIIRHNGPEHVFCFAPTRSGKGVGLVIPTLLSWTGSAVVYDIKKELWTATAGWRRTFSHTWRFEPTALDSLRFNPLDEIRKGDLEVRDTQNVADILVDPEGAAVRRDHWQSTAHTLLVGAILHVLYAEADKSLAGLASFLSDPGRTQVETLDRMLRTHHLKDSPHPLVAGCAREMMNKSDNELSGVFSTAMTCLGLYRDPIIARNTSKSDFRLSQLMQSEHPVSLYLVVPPSDIDRVRPLVRLFLNQQGRRLTERMEFEGERGYKHRLLFLLDEFPSLGRLAFFETELAYLAGYGIKCFLIAQSLSQIEKAYGAQNSILDNTHVRITYGALDERTAKRISDLLGQTTKTRTQVAMGGKRGALWLDHVTESQQEHARSLLTPGEILQLPSDEALLIVGGLYPYRARKVMYYQDERFKDRAWLPPPDAAEDQAKELLRTGANDWAGIVARPPGDARAQPQVGEGTRFAPAPSSPSNDALPEAATPETVQHARPPQPPVAVAEFNTAAWLDYFDDSEDVAAREADPPTKSPEEKLPL